MSATTTSNFVEIRDEEANASFLLGKRDVLLNNYQSACDHLSKACERIVKLRENDTSPELAEPYFYYGQALLYLGLSEQQVFGSDIVKDADNDETENADETNKTEAKEETTEVKENGNDEAKIDQNSDVKADQSTEPKNKEDEHTEDKESESSEAKKDENGESKEDKNDDVKDETIEEENDDEDDSIPDDENVSDLERAFEILECAHMIYTKMSEDNPNDAHIITRIADIHIMLSDICNENGDHENALSHVLNSIELQETISEEQRYRLLAESYYKLGLIYELINKFADAVVSFNKAIDAINQAVKQLDGEDKESEREDLKSLLPSIVLRRNDAKASIADRHLIAQARKILTGTDNTIENKTTDGPVKDLTLNVRHKRPVMETENDDDTNKKARLE